MKKQAYQKPELRDENDKIVQEGTYGKHSPICSSTNDGIIDYINNNLEALHDSVTGSGEIETTNLTVTGETSVPTANIGNSSKAIANTEFVQKFVNAKAGNYLPLSGGTMTGDIKVAAKFFGIRHSYTADDGQLSIFGGNGNSNGALMSLNGKNYTNGAGVFSITAHNGTNYKQLIGKPDGTLTWGGDSLALAKDYLPLSGGTMTGVVNGTLNGNAASATKLETARTINVTDADGTNTGTGASFNGTNNATIKLPRNIRLYDLTFPDVDGEIRPGGADGQRNFAILAHTNDLNYSNIWLSSKTNGNGNGYISIASRDGKDSSQLLLTPTGASYNKTLKTTIDGNATSATKATNDGNGNNIASTYLPLSGGTMTGTLTLGTDAKARGVIAQNGTTCFRIASGEYSYNNSGAFIHLYSQTADNDAGNFKISAHNSSNECALVGKPDGTLTWNGKKITVNSNTEDVTITADSTNVASIGGYNNAYRCGCVVTLGINVQVKGGLAKGAVLFTGLLKPKINIGACLGTESVALRVYIDTSGNLKLDQAGPSSNTWCNGCITYITID